MRVVVVGVFALCVVPWSGTQPSLAREPPVSGLGTPFLWSSAGLFLWSPRPLVLICGPRGCS